MKITNIWELRAIADVARDSIGDVADREADAYCRGVEDVLRYITGDAAPTAELAALLANMSDDEPLPSACMNGVCDCPATPDGTDNQHTT